VLCRSVEGATLDYFHIRLAEQDVIFSEGAHSESYDDVSTLPDHLVRALPSNRMSIFHSRVRSAVSPWIDRRRPGDAVWERLAERAETQVSL
jgi:hypothetical protein